MENQLAGVDCTMRATGAVIPAQAGGPDPYKSLLPIARQGFSL